MTTNNENSVAGNICHICRRELSKQSFTGTISFRGIEPGIILKKKACVDCLNKHFSRGE